jgi:tyrosine-protein phosphatase SIW14
MTRYLIILLLLISASADAEPRLRPDNWGKPIIGTGLDNLYQVDKGVYRSEQPDDDDIENLVALGIQEVLNLREYHSDKGEIGNDKFVLHRIKMQTGAITQEQIIQAMQVINNRKGPILIHCWHGSDRTGVTIAAYRIIFNHWSKAQAIDELKNGGYGYHGTIYPELLTLIENLDIEKIKQALISIQNFSDS